MKRLLEHTKRIIRITGGIVVIVVGIILSVPGVPGPGLIVVFIGLSILAVDFVWARRLKMKLKEQAGKVMDKVRGKPSGAEVAAKKP
jgi:tellurite resistance protein TerC